MLCLSGVGKVVEDGGSFGIMEGGRNLWGKRELRSWSWLGMVCM